MENLSRRSALTGFGMMGLAGLAADLPNTAQAADLPDIETPQGNLENLLRTSASLDPEDCPWYYNGTIFGIVGEEAPRPLYTFKGMEIYQTRKLEEGKYFFTGGTVSFITELESHDWLYKFQNPYTGKTNDVPAADSGARRIEHFLTYSDVIAASSAP